MRGVQGLDYSVSSELQHFKASLTVRSLLQYTMDLEYPAQAGGTGPLFVTTHAAILSASDPQIRFSVKGQHGSYTKTGLDPQESYLKLGIPARGEGYGVEAESLWGKIQMAKEEGGEALTPPQP